MMGFILVVIAVAVFFWYKKKKQNETSAQSNVSAQGNGVSLFYLVNKSCPIRPVLTCACVELFDDFSIRINFGDIGYLSCYSLMSG